jgi:hypothetical protein
MSPAAEKYGNQSDLQLADDAQAQVQLDHVRAAGDTDVARAGGDAETACCTWSSPSSR